MKNVPDQIVKKFSDVFASGSKGLSLDQISTYFEKYESNIPPIDGRYGRPLKPDHFHACLRALSPAMQRNALSDLIDDPPVMRGKAPSVAQREELRLELEKCDGVTPLGRRLSKITLRGVSNDWIVADAKISSDPASAITAARALLEATCKTILTELSITPNNNGDVCKLFKQTCLHLGIDTKKGASQSIYQICSGLANTIQGLSSLSNLAGDRHGLAGGKEISEENLAQLAVNASGTVSTFLVNIYRLKSSIK